jgi:peroxiredoxin
MTPTRIAWLVVGVLATIVLMASAPAAPQGATMSPGHAQIAQLNQPAPDFKLKDCFAKDFTGAEFKGKIVVLEWLNPGCPVSHGAHEKAKMQTIYKRYADHGVVWLGIDSTSTDNAEKDRVYAAQMGLAYPILVDADGKVGHSFQAKRTPHMFVIDRDGNLAYEGAIDDQKDKNYVAAAIDDLLAGRPVAKPKTDPYGCGIKYATPK